MGLYNFQPRFVTAIRSGAKRQTIRGLRAHPDSPGCTLHLYTGLRQKGAKLLGRVQCVAVKRIEIRVNREVLVNGKRLSPEECQRLALKDGFRNFEEMMRFWDGRRPFRGQILFW